ncbi:helix-turn-helix domain-containing protein [Aerosticca soli]
MAELEREAIEQALERCGNDKTRAARMLGVSVKTIYNKLVRYQQ